MIVAGREDEIQIMQNLLKKKDSEFLAVYGRRRIGKTYLIRQVFEQSIVFEANGIHEKEMSQQLESFWMILLEVNPNERPSLPKTWLQAFSLLKNYINSIESKKKKIIFLDEIAWFETPRSGFLSALQNFWNLFCSKRKDIILIICGSSASWIIDKVINNKGGLHNRITSHIQLMPFTLQETKSFLELSNVKLTLKDIAMLYMSVGGVPYYLKDVKPGQSVPQILDDLFFKPQAILKNEFQNLYASLFKNSNLHIAIIKALATKAKGLTRNELLTATKLASGGSFTKLLDELTVCGFIKIIYPIDKNKEGFLYRLVDEYSIFYYKFLVNKKVNSNWLQFYNTQSYKIWTGYAFENLCFKHILNIKKALGINGIISNEYSWIYKENENQGGVQIDFIIDRSDNCINILELKFYDALFEMTKKYADEMHYKVSLFKEKTKSRKNIFTTLLTANGVKKNEYYLSAITNELKIEDLF
ncbi:ATP-binding protein [Flavobacterium sp.]|uniref:AAA family ATPase n=1 Tax=Flavobacterium sp. TaxID=239 RepID=UPI00286D97B6|nr:ATP-binding protein [Flavobacterium sp.]